MPGSPKKRARREAAGLPVAPRMHVNLAPVVLRKMRERGVDFAELVRFGLNDENKNFIMGYDGNSEPGVINEIYLPTSTEREAVQNWVVAGYKAPLKIQEMLLEDFGLDLTIGVIQRAFRMEFALGKERIAVEATKNVISAIKDGDVPASFRFLESAGKWHEKEQTPLPSTNITYNTQINVSAENAAVTYQEMIKAGGPA